MMGKSIDIFSLDKDKIKNITIKEKGMLSLVKEDSPKGKSIRDL